jgi:LysM repeat protein
MPTETYPVISSRFNLSVALIMEVSMGVADVKYGRFHVVKEKSQGNRNGP